MKGIWEYSMELWRKKKRKNCTKKESSLETVPAKLRESFQPKMAVVSQGCRFVPDTFSETIRHRWYQAGSKYWCFTRVWQLDETGQIYDPVSFMIFSFRLPWRFSGSLMQRLFGVSGSAISTTCAIVGRCSPPKNWIKIGSS